MLNFVRSATYDYDLGARLDAVDVPIRTVLAIRFLTPKMLYGHRRYLQFVHIAAKSACSVARSKPFGAFPAASSQSCVMTT